MSLHPSSWIWNLALGAIAALVGVWLVFVAVLLICKPRGALGTALCVLPDLVTLLRRLVADPGTSRRVRIRLWLLLAYLALPVDLIPDFIPVIGHADDVIVAIVILRSALKQVGAETLRQHWPGTDEGLALILRLAGVERSPSVTPPT